MKTSIILKSVIILFFVFCAFNVHAKGKKTISTDNHMFPSQFFRDFPKAENTKWNVCNDIYNVTFRTNGLASRAVYSSTGIFSYSIINYPPDRLPANMLKKIYKAYKNYKIHSANELNAHGSSAFHIILEDKTAYLTIKMTNKGFEIIKKLRKSVEE